MSEQVPAVNGMSAAKLALLGRHAWNEQGWLRGAEPIAIVGMACRFPGGVNDPETLWRLLREGRDAVTEVPRDRWNLDDWFNADPAAPGRIATRWGGFLDDIRGFDAAYFDISPREAERMDPQQRITLEVACEAFEDAGIALHSLRGSDTGVFFASYHNDYTLKQYADVETIGARTLTGTLHSVLANRISYVLGLHGPSLAIDSACSSSLVATHLACQALRSRDCDLAVAGGVNVMITPHITVALSKGGFMSPTGRCRTFDASADGFVRSEGCAAVVLKRLSDAIANGDEIFAVIRGSAVNQDGESTNLSAPNGLAQEALVRKAMRNAGVTAEQVSLIETHGTGTELGDPIETDALAAVFRGRAADAGVCYLGSLKANLGHCEAAAGVAGLIKTVLCIRHRTIPTQVHFNRLNPHISLHGTPFRIATANVPWTPAADTRIAGVSSFGVGGTNAHVILEEPLSVVRSAATSPPWLLPLSARSAESLRRLAAAYAEELGAGAEVWGEDVGVGAGTHRWDCGLVARAAARRRMNHREYRAAVAAMSAEALIEQLQRIAAGTGIAEPAAEAPKLGFVYSGQGTQWAGMGLALMEQQPVFRASIERLDLAWRDIDGRSLIEELTRASGESRLDRTDIAQVGIFAVQVALTELLASWGIAPSVVIGHSVGELAAAVAAGRLDANTALRAVSERGRVMQATYDSGRMLAVRASEADVQQRLASYQLQLSVAAVNGPNAVVLSGATDQVDTAHTLLQQDGIEAKLLDVRFGFHSQLMHGAARELAGTLHGLQATDGAVPLISTVTGQELEQLDAEYLARNIESPVRFMAAIERALTLGVSHFVELGPHPALGQAILETSEARKTTGHITFALHRDRPAALTTRSLVARLYEWGVDPDWTTVDPGQCPPVRLPRYPWAHRPYWLPEPQLTHSIEYELADPRFAALRDHRIAGRAILPATALLELIRHTAQNNRASIVEVHGVTIVRPVDLEDGGLLQLEFDAEWSHADVFVLRGNTREHVAEGALVSVSSHDATTLPDPAHPAVRVISPDANAGEITREHFYRVLRRDGCNFGSEFQLLSRIRVDAVVGRGVIEARSSTAWMGDVQPAVVDACAQLCIAVLEQVQPGRTPGPYLPWAADRYVVYRSTERATAGRVVLREAGSDAATFDVDVLDDVGVVLVRIEGWRLRRSQHRATMHHIDWVAQPLPSSAETTQDGNRWLIVHDDTPFASELSAAFGRAGLQAAMHDASADLSAKQNWAGVVFTADVSPADVDPLRDAVLPAQVSRLSTRLLSLAQRIAGHNTRLLVVTRGTQPVGALGDRRPPAASGVWGLARAIRAELPELRCTALDLDAVPSAADADAVVVEALIPDGSGEVALRAGVRLVARLAAADFVPVETSGPSRLVLTSPGTLDGFGLRSQPAAAPEPDAVTVEVLAAGVNFRDVLTALGEYPGEAAMGFEACGVVVGGVFNGLTAEGEGVGEGVFNGLTAEGEGEGVSEGVWGRRVLVFWPGCFATRVRVPRSFVFPAPAGLDPAAAATIPVAFGTAWFALHRIGGVGRGIRVLVHSGAGGVGMAAIQLALRAGAEVYATAGTPEKRALLERLGVAGAFDSRSPSFEGGVLAATGGEGVDIVINSLTGPLIPAGLRCLRSGGVFVELGKREILDAAQLHAIRDDVRYAVFDLREEALSDPTLLPGIFAELIPLFEQGELKPLPDHTFRLAEAGDAFRRIARAEHVGKIVLVPDHTAGLQRDGWYVVTGGLGALGQASARWLADRGARRIALLTRGAASPESAASGGSIGTAEVRELRADVADAGALRAALEELRRTGPILGVIHAAGVVDDALLTDLTADRIDAVLAPKVAGAWNLHHATRDDPLDLFVLFSAAGPVLNAAGLGSYAAANSFLDALATYRRSRGLPGVSVLWGPWAGGGMAAGLKEVQRARWSRLGLDWWTPELAGPALDRIAGGVHEQVLALRLRPEMQAPTSIARRTEGASRPTTDSPSRSSTLTARIRELPSHRQLPSLVAHVSTVVTTILGRETPVEVDKPLRDLGLDSLGAIELRNHLAVEIGEALPATLAFDHPTVTAIAAHLHSRVTTVPAGQDKNEARREAVAAGMEAAPTANWAEDEAGQPMLLDVEMPAPQNPQINATPILHEVVIPAIDPDAICVVGVGIRAPGGVTSLDEYARLLFDGIDAVGPVPPGRSGMPGEQGGFLDAVDQFDPEFFGIAPLEASTMDPQQRILLETVWEALEHAGIAPTSLRGSRAGVFVGIGTADYHRMVMADPAGIDTYASTGTAFSVASGRIAYVLGLNGPAISVDTACSSSLVAVHLAVQSLRQGESDIAIAAGVNLILSPELTVNFRQAGMLSPGSRCRTFDAQADGYVRGEGCGVVVLKRAADAIRNGDRVLAVIRGSALNQDGRSSGLTAPSGPAQAAVIRDALANAGLQPEDIAYLEAHGTGTALGDPIELQAIGAVFGERSEPLLVGSAKTNLGHLEAAAGIAGLIKAIVSVRHQEIPPHLNFDVPSPQIPWERLPVSIPTRRTPFAPINGARRAGVSSFGFSGTNAHVIVEEAPPLRGDAPQHDRPVHLLTLSAPHHAALRALALRYADHLEQTSDPFADICLTANAGRAHFGQRLAIVAVDARSAAATLRTWFDKADSLTDLRDSPKKAELRAGEASHTRPAIGFLFPAAIEQVCTLQHTSAVVRDVLDACDPQFRAETGIALRDVLTPTDGPPPNPQLVIPARFVVQHALAELWRSWGIEPDLIAAEPLGELAAGVAAGILERPDALRLAVAAGRAHRAGAGMDNVVRGLSPALTLQPPSRHFLSAAAPNANNRACTTPSFWAHVLTGRGRLTDLAPQLQADGARWLVSIGAAPRAADRDALLQGDGLVVGAPAAGVNVWDTLLTALAELYVAGANPDWNGFDRGWQRRKVTLPSYPFQRRRFWYAEMPNATRAWAAAVSAAQERAQLAPIDLDIGSYGGKWKVLQEFAEAVGRNTLIRLGAFVGDAPFDLERVIQRTGIEPLYRPIVRRWLDALARAGELAQSADGWRATGQVEPIDLEPLQTTLDTVLADDPALLRYVLHAAPKVESVLTGRTSPLETLFPDGSFDLAADLYESAGPLRYTNGIAAAALRAWAEAHSGPVRVLEIGAGTGGTTASLVRVLPASRTAYSYTDVSQVFLDFGRERFAGVPFLQTRLFDLEQEPAAQGIDAGSYDVVVGSNVLHAMRDLPAALRRVRELLAPGGVLLLVESTGHHAWHDITTGLIEGWQHFDDGRAETPLLSPERWRELLLAAGFDAVEAAPLPDSRAAVLKQHLVLVRVPEVAVRYGVNGLNADGEGEGGLTAEGEDVGEGGLTADGEGEGVGEGVLTADGEGEGVSEGVADEGSVAELVRACVMEVLRSDPGRPPSKDGRLMDLGVDSLMAVRLRNLVEQRLGVKSRLPSTLVFDYPTIRQIARLVVSLEAAGGAGREPGGDAVGRRESDGSGKPARSGDPGWRAPGGRREREIAALSDADAEALLLERLGSEEGL